MEVIVLSIPVICFIVFVHHVQGKHFAVEENDELMIKELMTSSEEEGVKLGLKPDLELFNEPDSIEKLIQNRQSPVLFINNRTINVFNVEFEY